MMTNIPASSEYEAALQAAEAVKQNGIAAAEAVVSGAAYVPQAVFKSPADAGAFPDPEDDTK